MKSADGLRQNIFVMKFFRNFLLTTVILSLMIWTGCEYFKGKSEGIHIAVVVPQNTVAGKSTSRR